MKKIILLIFLAIQFTYPKAQVFSCNVSTLTPNGIFYAGPVSNFSTTVAPIINYLCPNAVVYDTLTAGDRWAVMIEPGANYIWNMCGAALSNIFVKAGGTITFTNNGCPTAKYLYLEPGAIVVDPFGATSANTLTLSCTSLTFPFVNCLTSVHDLEKNNFNFSVHPNPVSNSIKLSLQSDVSEKVNIKLSNQIGETVLYYHSWNSSQKEIPINDLSNGIYFISIESKGISRTKKIVVLK